MAVSAEILEFISFIESTVDSSDDHMAISSTFGKILEGLPDGDLRKEVVGWEVAFHDYHLSHTAPEKGLQPFMSMGGQEYPGPVVTLPDALVDYAQQRFEVAKSSVTRARLADVLWLRHKAIHFAEAAITAYLASATAVLPSTRGRSLACDYLARAVFLALSLNRDIQPVLTTIRALAERFIRDEDGHLASLIEAAIPALDRDPGLGEWLITEVTALARRKAVPPDQSRILERHLYQVVLKLAPIRRDVNRARAIRLEMAGSFEKEAEEREGESALIQSAILQDAIQGYQEAGDSEAVARLKPALHAATQRAAENLHTISTEITVPTDVFRKHVEACLTEGQKHGPAFHLHLFAMNEGLWPRWSDVSKRTAEMNQEFPIQALVRKTTLTHDGRPHERPEEPDKRREYDEIHRYVEDLQFQLAFTARKMEMFRERNAWNEALFIDALAEGVLFDKEIIEAVRPGIQAFEAKWNWEAIHVLIPQVERIVRKLAKTLGAETVRYVPATGELHWTSLKILLSVPSVKQVLASVSQDFAAELGYLLIDSRGLNLRDDVAHGILPVDTDHHRLALLCVLIMLTLSTLVRGGDAAASDTPEVQ